MTEENSKNKTKLREAAISVLKANDKGQHTVPSPGLYPHQWFWDSCFIAIGMAHYDIERAQIEILSLLRAQWANGMMPNIIMHSNSVRGKTAYDRHSRIWRSYLNPNAPNDISTSGITQPPMLAEAIYQIGQKLTIKKRREWYKSVYHSLVNYHLWIYQERDPHNEGLALQIHPWEVGLDNTPPWMSELNDHLLPWWIRFLNITHLDDVFGLVRSDNKLALKNQRLTNTEALALYDVQRRLRRKNYDFKKIIDHSLFAIEDLTFNSILIRGNYLLREIANFLELRLPEELIRSMHKSVEELNELWDEYSQEYFSRDFVSHRLIKVSSIACFMPLYSGAIKKDRAQRIIEALDNEHRYKSIFPVPSVPMDSPWFQPERYWQGPTWINTNWLIIQGLKNYGFQDYAKKLQLSTIDLVANNGFHEYYDPITGQAIGIDNFSWTAALIIDLLKN